VQLGPYILPYKPAHAPGFSGQHPLNQTAILQTQAAHSSQTLQQTLATECKNKENEKEKETKQKKNPFEKQP
jgi:hypothetical protein